MQKDSLCIEIASLVQSVGRIDVLAEGMDTVYIRKGREFKELFPPEEQRLHTGAYVRKIYSL